MSTFQDTGQPPERAGQEDVSDAPLRRAIFEAMGRGKRCASKDVGQPTVGLNLTQGEDEDIAAAVAVLWRLNPSEVTAEVVEERLTTVRTAAARRAEIVGQYLDNMVEHLQAIGCQPNQVFDYMQCADEVLVRLYSAASRPSPSPGELKKLVLQFALDAREPIEGNSARFVLEHSDGRWMIIEYPSLAQVIPEIPRPGRIVGNVFATRLMDFVAHAPPDIHGIKCLIELLVDDVADRAHGIVRPGGAGSASQITAAGSIHTDPVHSAHSNDSFAEHPVAEDLVTFSQLAKMVFLSPATLRKYKKDMPPPVHPHRGRNPAKWSLQSVRPFFKDQLQRPLPNSSVQAE